MSVESVKNALAQWGLAERIQEFEVSSATVELAAQALGVEPSRIAKSLTFCGKEGGCVMVVAAGDRRIDNAKFKAAFGMKAKMLPHDDALALTGHAVGGVCPFAVKPGVPVWLDESLKAYDVVYPAAGSASSAVRLTVAELEQAAQPAGWVDVTKA